MAFAQSPQARVYSNDFLNIGAGARAQGMANSLVSGTDDVYSIFWNPAGLARVGSDIQLGLNHTEYFQGAANYDFGGIAFKLKDSAAFGVGVVRLGVDDIPNTIFLVQPDGTIDFNQVSSFAVADYAVFLSYGRTIGKLRLGGSSKIIYRNVGPFAEAWGFGLDAGIQYDLGKFTLAAMGKDITSTWNAWNFSLNDAEKDVFLATGNEIPENSIEVTLPRLVLGGAFKTNIGSSFSLNTELNLINYFGFQQNSFISSNIVNIDPSLGLEIGFRNVLFARAGLGNVQTQTYFDPNGNTERMSVQPNAGLGLKISALTVDYAFSDLSNQSVVPYSHIISIRFDLGKDIIEKNLSQGKNNDE
ncbi:MAG: PorV/PorQ family protein [Bacteroidetes bacterium]|nr:PorV/PorQ family protein [Bacteroidota bacterium]